MARAHIFSTYFTAYDLAGPKDFRTYLDRAVRRLSSLGVSRVYLEAWRGAFQHSEADRLDGCRVPASRLAAARAAFESAGIGIRGGITPTGLGRSATGCLGRHAFSPCWNSAAARRNLTRMFRYAAGQFDDILIDDFFWFDCYCEDCRLARGRRPWEDYRREFMAQLALENVIGPIREANPRCRAWLKFPVWYRDFSLRGYDVAAQSRVFDGVWAGTETRDFVRQDHYAHPAYMAFFFPRWVRAVAGSTPLGGGWYDFQYAPPHIFVEQARQTVLAGLEESVLFSGSGVMADHHEPAMAAWRREQPRLLEAAAAIRDRAPLGIPCLMSGAPEVTVDGEVHEILGVNGIPLVPVMELGRDNRSAFISQFALRAPGQWRSDFDGDIPRPDDFWPDCRAPAGLRVLATEAARHAMPWIRNLSRDQALTVPSLRKWEWRKIPAARFDRWRRHVLEPYGIVFSAPRNVGLYLFTDGSWVIENFSDRAATVKLQSRGHSTGGKLKVPPREWVYEFK